MAKVGLLVRESTVREISGGVSERPSFFVASITRLPASEADRLRQALSGSQARMLVVALTDLKAADQVVRLARLLNPGLYILVRTASDGAVEQLTLAGANLVIPEEFETSIEIFSRVLREYRIPNHVIEQQVELVRMEGYSMFRGLSLNVESLARFSTYLAATLTESVQVEADHWAAGRQIGQLELKQHTGTRLIAFIRGGQVHPNPEPGLELAVGDVLILFGRHAMLDKAVRQVREGPHPAADTLPGGAGA